MGIHVAPFEWFQVYRLCTSSKVSFLMGLVWSSHLCLQNPVLGPFDFHKASNIIPLNQRGKDLVCPG